MLGNPLLYFDPDGRQTKTTTLTWKGLMEPEGGMLGGGYRAATTTIDVTRFNFKQAVYDMLFGVSQHHSQYEQKVSQPLLTIQKRELTYNQKIKNDMNKRGWTESSVQNTVENPSKKKPTINRKTKNKATAYFDKDGSYVVIDDVTNQVVQVSKKNDPDWKVDKDIGKKANKSRVTK